MSAKPFRNSKGVNKPFRSPFNTTPQNKNTENVNTPEPKIRETPLKVSVTRKLLFATPPTKKLRLSDENCENQAQVEQDKELYQTDLELVKKRIQEKQESINNLKTTLLYKRKNKAEDLETAIRKWTDACQAALKDYHNDLQERNGQSMSMTEILSSLGIDPGTVRFSTDDETFY